MVLGPPLSACACCTDGQDLRGCKKVKHLAGGKTAPCVDLCTCTAQEALEMNAARLLKHCITAGGPGSYACAPLSSCCCPYGVLRCGRTQSVHARSTVRDAGTNVLQGVI